MLVSLNFDPKRLLIHNNRKETLKFLKDSCSQESYKAWVKATVGDVLTEIKPGIYEYYDVNAPDICLNNQKLDTTEEADYETACQMSATYGKFNKINFPRNLYISYPYGVCDNYEQILERVEKINYYLESDKKFCIVITPIEKSRQPAMGGWRWHKWGAYIGDQDSTSEYLYDEPNIEKVYVYHIYRVYEK